LDQNIHWKPGDTVLLRGVWRRKLWFAIVAYIVQDTYDLIALYWRAGTPNKIPERRLTAKDLLAKGQLELIDSTWTRTDLLMLVKPGASHSVEVMWDGKTGEFLCWYINLQEPLRRTPVGFDTMDLALDVVISPDRANWRWKDEDEFAGMIKLGLISSSEAQAIRAEGKKAIKMAETNQPPFCDGWENWSPPICWQIPEFPTNWDQKYFGEF
jgi:predicted RNA-binding protein associated with RNAse of E/G family